jgi:hypothetical protein
MGFKARIRAKFPAHVVAQSPLSITKEGRNYTLELDAASVLGGDVTVFQLRRALRVAGYFDDVENALAVDPGALVYEAWIAGGQYTSYGDNLSNAVAAIIGAAATQAAYTAAESISL